MDVVGRMMSITSEQARVRFAESTMLKVSPLTSDSAKAVFFLVSDRATNVDGYGSQLVGRRGYGLRT